MPPENPLKVVFENLRDLLACVTIITLAAAACRFHQHLWFSLEVVVVLAGVLVLLTVCLLVANTLHIFRRLHHEGRWLTLGVLAGIYICVVVLVVHAVPAIGFK